MIRIQVSKLKYVELINNELQKHAQHTLCTRIKAVPAHVNPRGYILTNETPIAKAVLDLAITEVEKKYWYETN
jgi:hypothetical protein